MDQRTIILFACASFDRMGRRVQSEKAGREMKKTLYTFGYLGGRAERIISELIAVKTPAVDIRFSPTSRRYEWTQEALSKRLGTQYIWLQSLGNELYQEALSGKSGEPHVRLHDVEQGLAELAAILDQHGRAAIFCACANKTKCHRMVVATLAIVHLDVRVTHL